MLWFPERHRKGALWKEIHGSLLRSQAGHHRVAGSADPVAPAGGSSGQGRLCR